MADDYVCPICLNVMIEPVTLPCSHGLCKTCLDNTLNEAAMQCPICRYRLSIWVRRTRKKGGLINQEKWKKIKELFSNYVNQKMAGNTSVELTEEEQKIIQPTPRKEHVPRALAAPGELKREFELQLARLQEAEAVEESASLALVRQLEMEEQELQSVRQSAFERDAELAAELQGELDASLAASTPVAKRPRLGQPTSWLDRFMAEKRRLSNGSVDSIGPELRPAPFRPIEAFPRSPPKREAGAWPLLRPRAHNEASKENVCLTPASPIASRIRRRRPAGRRAREKGKLGKLSTSATTAFSPVAKPGRSILDFAVRSPKAPQEEGDLLLAQELQRRYDLEHRYSLTALRVEGEDDAYLFRHRAAKKT